MKDLLFSLECELREREANCKAQEMYVNALLPLKARVAKLEAEKTELREEVEQLKVSALKEVRLLLIGVFFKCKRLRFDLSV